MELAELCAWSESSGFHSLEPTVSCFILLLHIARCSIGAFSSSGKIAALHRFQGLRPDKIVVVSSQLGCGFGLAALNLEYSDVVVGDVASVRP